MVESLPKRIHCIGAGGAGMLPLALYLAERGHEITAEDESLSEHARRWLEGYGVRVAAFEERDDSAVVYSSAVAEDHPARVYARRVGAIAMRRGECLAVIARERRLIAIVGSHGKTTTCGMVIDLFKRAGVSADYLLGAMFEEDAPSAASDGPWLIAEIDESDGTIDLFHPEICVLLNADHDHHARYATEEDYLEVFRKLLRRTRTAAFVDAGLRERLAAAASNSSASCMWVGAGGDVDVAGAAMGRGWSEVTLAMPEGESRFLVNRSGAANRSNAAFAFLAARQAGCLPESGAAIEFQFVKRRQRCWYCSAEVAVVEDYAHHPREIAAALAQLREETARRIAVVFQPHRFSRTAALKGQLAESLAQADALALQAVYPASEAPVPGGASEDLLEACRALAPETVLLRESGELDAYLETQRAGDPVCVLFLGAGVGDRLARCYAERLAAADSRWGKIGLALAASAGFGADLRGSEPLANKTTLRVGGAAERYFEPASVAELVAVLKACSEAGMPARALGRGSNLVVPDEGVSGLTIRLSHPYWSRCSVRPDGSIVAGAGLRTKALCSLAWKEGLEGYEFLDGIPGSVGGALRMNAGAMGGWTFDVVKSVRYVTLRGDVVEARRDELDFGYRFCRELESAMAIEAVLRASAGRSPSEDIRRRLDTYQEKRRESQPREPSAGCIFKNPEGGSAGRIIDELGLKRTVVGGAEVSGTHGNFIVNRGGATSADVIELARFVREVARRKRGVVLEPEALLFGGSWEEALR